MLSTVRVASRQAAVRGSACRVVGAARQGSTWANVPQGPPVSLHRGIALVYQLTCDRM